MAENSNTFGAGERDSYSQQQVCAECEVPSHVLVYWSDYFCELKGEDGHLKSVFSAKDLELIRRIKQCLYSQRMTVQEAVRVIAEEKCEESPAAEATFSLESPKPSKEESETQPVSVPMAPVFALSSAVPDTPAKSNFSDIVAGGLKHLEEALVAQKSRFEDCLTDQREEFSAVQSECAAKVSDLSSELDCVKEKNEELRQLLERAIKELEVLRVDAFGDR